MVVVVWEVVDQVEPVAIQEWRLLITLDLFLYKVRVAVRGYWCNLWVDRVVQRPEVGL